MWDVSIHSIYPQNSPPLESDPEPKPVAKIECTLPAVNELRVYTRRNKVRGEQLLKSTRTCHESVPTPIVKESTGNEVLVTDFTIDIDSPIAVRKGTRLCTKYSIQDYVSFGNLSLKHLAFVSKVDNSSPEPKTVHEALQIPEWSTTIQAEISALEKNGIWELSELPLGKRLVGCKWIFTAKYNPNGSVNRLKARLVVKGLLSPIV